jgi:hypothetical protein
MWPAVWSCLTCTGAPSSGARWACGDSAPRCLAGNHRQFSHFPAALCSVSSVASILSAQPFCRRWCPHALHPSVQLQHLDLSTDFTSFKAYAYSGC